MDKTETEKNQDQEENTTERGLGELLKSYRESADMDIKQAASSLCLTPGTLQDLENENFDDLPEAPYIRGYLRGYAKLANVSSSEVIALYESVRGGKPEGIEQYRSRSQAVNDVIKPAIPPYVFQMGGVVLLLLLLIVLSMIPGVKDWASGVWSDFSQDSVIATEGESGDTPSEAETAANSTQSDSQEGSTATSTTPSVTGQNTDKPDAVAMDGMIDRKKGAAEDASANKTDAETPSNASPAQSASATAQAQVANASTETDNAAQTTTVGDGTTSTTASTAASDTTTASDSATATDNASTTTGENATTDSATTVDASPATTAETTEAPEGDTAAATTDVDLSGVDTASGEAVVKLVFKDEVWMRVNGVKNKKLFGGLKKSGDIQEFKASKPLSFKVGNAPGVDIYINGKLYDQTPHLRGVVSKFKIEAAAQ